ncbi:MAG: hypothetical protein ACKO5Q_10730, partial [Microcystaceae cyanobacterium]
MLLNPVYVSILDTTINKVKGILEGFADNPLFAEQFALVFGVQVSSQALKAMLTVLPPIEVRSDADLQGALGAFSAQTGKIYLTESLVKGDLAKLET